MKRAKLLSLGLTAFMAAAMLPVSAAAYEKGDVNHDGFVDARDASAVLVEYSVLSTGGTGTMSLADGDYNGDGFINAGDASCILVRYAELSTGGGQYGGEGEPEGVPCKVTLRMDFTDGSDTANFFEKEYTYCYRNPDGEEVAVTPEDIIKGLEEETGFNFSAKIEKKDDGIHIDFTEKSSLFNGQQALDHDEKYTFVHAPSKEWFILDTMAENMKQFGEKFNVYLSYCGRPIVLDEILSFDGTDTRNSVGSITIPDDKPYQGSSWYCAHFNDYLSEGTVWYLGDRYLEGADYREMIRFTKEGTWMLYNEGGNLLMCGTYDNTNVYAIKLYEDYFNDPAMNTHALVGEAHMGQYGLTLFIDKDYDGLKKYDKAVFLREGELGEGFFEGHAPNGETGAVELTMAEIEKELQSYIGNKSYRLDGTEEANEVMVYKAYLFSVGENKDDQFVVTEHYAVTIYGAVYKMDPVSGEYECCYK